MDTRHAFAIAAEQTPDLAGVEAAARLARDGERDSLHVLAAALMHAAFADPFAVIPVYDALTRGWLDVELPDSGAALGEPAPIPAAFWQDFWAHLDAQRSGAMPPVELTARVAGLGAALPIERRVTWEAAARAHPKAANAQDRAMPPKLTLAELVRQPAGSLAREFHDLVVRNGFDLEVLDRSGLETLPPALSYLNTRILQMHDVWHLMGGFQFTALHEIAISTFQLAQFGHGYSAMLLATAVTGIAFDASMAAAPILQTIAEAWLHGRRTPSFMAIAWEDEWHLPIAQIRARHGIVPFAGSLAPDMFEQARAA